MNGLIEGRIVHYVLPTGEHRPAIVVQVWRTFEQVDPNLDPGLTQELRLVPPASGCSNLQVFTDRGNDLPFTLEEKKAYENSCLTLDDIRKGMVWATSIMYSEEPKPNTWHWIERA
jgi:hypothetical protein